MDDKEYYSLMNRSSSFVINQVLKEHQKKRYGAGKSSPAKEARKSFTKLEGHQGRDDAEMLFEKQGISEL